MIAFIGSLSSRAREEARRRLLHLRRSEEGQAIVEFAIVLPLLLVILLAIIDFGRAINYWNTENYLANLGARYAAVGASISDTTPQCANQDAVLANYLKCKAGISSKTLQPPNGVSPGQPGVVNGVAVCVDAGNDQPGTPVTVRVSTNYDLLPFLHVGPTVTLTGTATMRVEQPASTGGLDLATGTTGTC